MSKTNVIEIDDSNFDLMVSREGVAIYVLFYTPTCLPCKEIMGVVNRASLKYVDTSRVFVKIDTSVSDHKKALEYEIRCHPTLLVFKNGVVIAKYEGCPANLDLDPFIETNY